MCRQDLAKVLNSRVFPGSQGGPLMHVIAAKAVAFKEALGGQFRDYQRQIVDNAKALAEALEAEGFRLVSGGTDNHMMLVDLSVKGITGKEAQEVLDRAGITVNKNCIPFDTTGPQITSGIRLGTPALTTRGMKAPQMRQIARFISEVLANREKDAKVAEIREDVRSLCEQFPLYAQRIAQGRSKIKK
jgi:glycine hydroxymethyltransferase